MVQDENATTVIKIKKGKNEFDFIASKIKKSPVFTGLLNIIDNEAYYSLSRISLTRL